MHTDTDQWAVRLLSVGHHLCIGNIQQLIHSALLFCRQSYWGSPPPDQWCPRLPDLWTPPPFSLSPATENRQRSIKIQHPTSTPSTTPPSPPPPRMVEEHKNDNLINISQHFYFPREAGVPPAVIVMTFSCQNACRRLGEGDACHSED